MKKLFVFLAQCSALAGAILSGFFFKKFIVSSSQKLSYFSFLTILLAVCSVLPLYADSFATLILVISIRFFLAMLLETPCQGMFVYTLGPERSRPFNMLFHCTVSVGFLLGPIVIGPFFPETESKDNIEEICNGTSTSGKVESHLSEDFMQVIESIKMPYWTMLYGHLFCAFGYIILMFNQAKMPVFRSRNKPSVDVKVGSSIEEDLSIILTIITFYMASCGSERLFQTLEFTFGLCGPLALTSRAAVVTDKCYNGGFFIGRLASIIAVKLATPKQMLKTSLTLCIFTSILLSLFGSQSANLLYGCAGIFGFAVSWNYASAYTWISEYLDVVGSKSSIFTIGCAISFVPTMAGAYLFHRWNSSSIWYLNLLLVIIQSMSFRRLTQKFQSVEYHNYKELKITEE